VQRYLAAFTLCLNPQTVKPVLSIVESPPAWCLIERDGEDLYMVSDSELLDWLKQLTPERDSADVTESGIRRWTIAPLPMQATLRQAMDTMAASTTEAVCIYERSRSSGKQIPHGIVTRESIEKFSLASVL
jgi:CIC family chloride channel protein